MLYNLTCLPDILPALIFLYRTLISNSFTFCHRVEGAEFDKRAAADRAGAASAGPERYIHTEQDSGEFVRTIQGPGCGER